MEYAYLAAATLAAYLIGSLSFAVIVSRLVGLADPRSYGSKNPGATNVLRSGNRHAAAATLVLDALKGFIPVFLVSHWGERWGLGGGAVAMVAVGAFAGHLWPVFFGFNGGKGVATAAGVLFGVHWALGITVLVSFGVILYFSRFVSLASMTAALFAPVAYLFGERVLWYSSRPVALALVVIAAMLIVKHLANVNRLLAGKEPRLGSESGQVAATAPAAKPATKPATGKAKRQV